ncbi:hypothetical protein MUK42_20981 [Musa troglodytarum]|uniref:Uncharacterized protein n=1 Tax=Musa troglodytarum TaxID=320322 RepID=A0A9E7K3G5_9LILI|nr:hypothetical protein MUK42_20981 [Musa troglodytarum]
MPWATALLKLPASTKAKVEVELPDLLALSEGGEVEELKKEGGDLALIVETRYPKMKLEEDLFIDYPEDHNVLMSPEAHFLLFKGRDFSPSFLVEQNSTAGGMKGFILLRRATLVEASVKRRGKRTVELEMHGMGS